MTSPTKEAMELERTAVLPLRRAEGVQTFSLFWVPARLKGMPDAQREWLIVFFSRLERSLSQSLKLERLQFLQSKTLQDSTDLQENFYRKLHRYSPLIGKSRSLNHGPVAKPTDQALRAFAKKGKKASLDQFRTEKAFRFRKDDGDFLKVFMGHGGMTLLFCGPGEELFQKAQLPPLQKVPLPKFLSKYSVMQTMHKDFNPEEPNRPPPWLTMHPSMQALKNDLGVDLNSVNAPVRMDTFGKKSKEIFGSDIKDSSGFQGLAFVRPRLSTQDFLSHLEEDVRKWFEVFDVYIRESPEDEGFVIASKHDLRPIFREVLETIHEDGYVYWEG